jgi:hypothetical protein
MTEKEHYLNSLSTGRISALRQEWKKIMEQRPNYWIARSEYELLTSILYKRLGKQTWNISPDTL